MTELSFGIGCFMFEARESDLRTLENPSGTYLIQDWAKDVKIALEAIPSVDSIHIESPTGISGRMVPELSREIAELAAIDNPNSFHRGGPFTPSPMNGRIQFRVSIPHHVQERLAFRSVKMRSTQFVVDIHFTGTFPVTFVSGDQTEHSPSMAIMIVREFLREEFSQRKDKVGSITFSCMGPSPFWVDCHIEIGDLGSASDGLSVAHEVREGYDTLRFAVSRDIDEPVDFVKLQLVPEASLFYSMVSERSLMYLNRGVIDHQIKDLIELHQQSGLTAWLKRLAQSGRQALELNVRVLQTEGWVQREQRNRLTELEELETLHPRRFLKPWIDRELSSLQSDPDAEKMVQLIASTHSRTVEIVSVIASSIGGGAIGAALAAIIGS